MAKSFGNEETFPHDRFDRAELDGELLRLADRLAGRLRRSGVRARTVQLKVRFADFRTVTRARTLPTPTDLVEDLVRTGRDLLAAVDISPGVRLLGLSAQHLTTPEAPGAQLLLALDAPGAPPGSVPAATAEDGETRRARLAASLDQVRARYGHTSIRPARLSPPPRP